MQRILIAALMALMFSPAAARAQNAEDARTFVLYYYDLLDTGGLEKVAPLYHPDEVEELRELTADVMAQDTAGDLAFFLVVRDAAGFLALSPTDAIGRILDLALMESGLHSDNRNVTVTVGNVVPDEFDAEVVHVTYHQKGEIDGKAVDREDTMSLRTWLGEWRALFPPVVREMLELWNEPFA